MIRIRRLQIIIVSLLVGALFASCSSCSSNTGNANTTMDTQFSVTVSDSIHLLSPKTYSHLKNIDPPLGIVPVVVTVDSIADSDMGIFADNIFDEYCDKEYSGATFEQRGILLVVSAKPKLIQVRVGKTYSVYCRMRGSTAGGEYLKMQKSIEERGVDEMCPIVLANTIADIEDCRNMPFYKKAFFKMIFSHIEIFLDDLATPSESFFCQFYFKPFIYVISVIHGLVKSWLMAFFVVCCLYMICKKLIDDRVTAMLENRVKRKYGNKKDVEQMARRSNMFMKNIVAALLKLIVTIPTLSAITILSTSRMEDIIALKYAHIPYTDIIGDSLNWDNSSPVLWTILLLMAVYYLKFLFCDKGVFTLAHCPDFVQRNVYAMDKANCDIMINNGYNRRILQRHAESVVGGGIAASMDNNSAIELQDNGYTDTTGNNGESKNWIDVLFISKDDDVYKQSPYFALLKNTHHEALGFAFTIGIVASVILSSTYIVFFLVLWTTTLLMRMYREYRLYAQVKGKGAKIDCSRFLKSVWKSLCVFFVVMAAVLYFMLPVYSAKQYEKIDVSAAIPEDITGLYFVQKRDGVPAKGVTARIRRDDSGAFAMYVYSDEPVIKYALDFDREQALLNNEYLGTGYIEFDKETKRIKINFADKWVLTN